MRDIKPKALTEAEIQAMLPKGFRVVRRWELALRRTKSIGGNCLFLVLWGVVLRYGYEHAARDVWFYTMGVLALTVSWCLTPFVSGRP